MSIWLSLGCQSWNLFTGISLRCPYRILYVSANLRSQDFERKMGNRLVHALLLCLHRRSVSPKNLHLGSHRSGLGTRGCPTLDFTICLFYTGKKMYKVKFLQLKKSGENVKLL